jgi:hypothetical protein
LENYRVGDTIIKQFKIQNSKFKMKKHNPSQVFGSSDRLGFGGFGY